MVSTQVGWGVRVVRDWMDCRPLLVNSVVVSKTANAWQQSSPEIAISSRQEVLFNHRFKKHIYGTHTGCVSDRNTHNTQQLVASPTVVSTQHCSADHDCSVVVVTATCATRRVGVEFTVVPLCRRRRVTLHSYRGGVHVRPAAPRARAVPLHVT